MPYPQISIYPAASYSSNRQVSSPPQIIKFPYIKPSRVSINLYLPPSINHTFLPATAAHLSPKSLPHGPRTILTLGMPTRLTHPPQTLGEERRIQLPTLTTLPPFSRIMQSLTKLWRRACLTATILGAFAFALALFAACRVTAVHGNIRSRRGRDLGRCCG